ncbi:MAG TPA: hypothetical protein VMQ44_02810 [Candidatus Saccharimonadales bacterium]|nr:hypothetical protein [Candidatus Saccharimonadales bacterium]
MIYATIIARSRTNIEELTYSVPANIIPYIRVGSLVVVPLRQKLVQGVVVGLSRRVSADIRDKVRPVESVSKMGMGFSPARVRVIERLAEISGSSLGEVATSALRLPETLMVGELTPKRLKPIVWQATWPKRLEFYLALIKKHSAHHRLVFVFALGEHASILAEAVGEKAMIIDDNVLSRKKPPEFSKNIIIGTLSAIFFPLKPADYLIIDQPDQLGLRQQHRPYLSAKTIAMTRGEIEGVQVVFGSTLLAVADVGRIKNRDWKLFNHLKPSAALTIINRHGSRDELLPSTLETIKRALTAGRALIFSAYKDEAFARLRAALPQKPAEISSPNNIVPGNTKLVLATEKILSFPNQRFEITVMTDVERFLGGKNLDDPWKFLAILFELGELSPKIIIQTYEPDHWVFQAFGGNIGRFYATELKERQRYQLPPYGTEIKIIGVAKSEAELLTQAKKVVAEVEKLSWISQAGEFEVEKISPRNVFGHLTVYCPKAASISQKTRLKEVLPPAWRLLLDA